jgi:hypothetical protein
MQICKKKEIRSTAPIKKQMLRDGAFVVFINVATLSPHKHLSP